MYNGPKIFNIYKPVGRSSQEIVYHFKKNLPEGFGKIGHFGTLDPFAEGVLMIGVNGAARLNDYIHEYLPKTYIATGVLGLETPTGDLTVPPSQEDTSEYFRDEISKLPLSFLNDSLKKKFEGDYMQAPHYFSAAKHEGKALHEWARAGVKIKKEKKKKYIYHLEVLSLNFPEIIFKVQVTSGTYVRTLFSDMANFIGTYGTLKRLIRDQIGEVKADQGLLEANWPIKERGWDIEKNAIDLEKLLPFKTCALSSQNISDFKHGREIELKISQTDPVWVKNDEQIIGLGNIRDHKLKPKINFFKV